MLKSYILFKWHYGILCCVLPLRVHATFWHRVPTLQVQENWGKRLHATVPSHTLEQVRTCTEIALRFVELEREKRPNITEIVNELNKIDVDESSDTGQVLYMYSHFTLLSDYSNASMN